jgi:hypothetical protein
VRRPLRMVGDVQITSHGQALTPAVDGSPLPHPCAGCSLQPQVVAGMSDHQAAHDRRPTCHQGDARGACVRRSRMGWSDRCMPWS